MNKKKAVILFSGGLDSTTCLAQAQADGFECYALSFHYGQKHSVELENAKAIAKAAKVVHRIEHLPVIGGSALTDMTSEVQDYSGAEGVPTTYVPARNTIFLSMALSWAESLGANDIFIGANCIDYSNYPDCRPEYLEAFEKLAGLGTKMGLNGSSPFKIHSPLLLLNKAQIIQLGLSLGVDYGQTISCYRATADGISCGTCESCTFRRKGFVEAGVADPTRYM